VSAVLDTNVLVSGIFFGGVPRAVLHAWAEGRFELVLSPSIIDEYVQTCARLGASHPGLEYQSILATLVGHGTLVPDTTSRVASGSQHRHHPGRAPPPSDSWGGSPPPPCANPSRPDVHLLESHRGSIEEEEEG